MSLTRRQPLSARERWEESMRAKRNRRYVQTAVAIALLSIIALAPSSIANGASDRIAYARLLAGGGAEILTANPDGSDEQLVPLEDPAEDFGIPIWSPDRSHLLISHTLRFDANGDVLPFRPAIVRPDGSDYRVLAVPEAPFDGGCFGWSVDASHLICAFGGDEPGVFSIRATDGGDLRRLTTNPFGGMDVPADVSPDGSKIVFIRQRPGPAPDAQPFLPELFALYVMDIDGSNQRQIVPYGAVRGHEIQGAHWSPDGRSIISANTQGRLFTVSPSGGALRFIKLGIRGFAFEPNWSPNGDRIIFCLFASDQEDLYTADPDGAHVERVTATPDFENGPDWR
jgi:Tol biopolymer transport system component